MNQTRLFSFGELEELAPESKKNRTQSRRSPNAEAQAELKISARLERCQNVVGPIAQNKTFHLVSAADWSTHDLIEHALESTGPAMLTLATWSISPDGIKTLLRLRDVGKLLGIRAVLDWRNQVRAPGAVALAKDQCDAIRLTSCHAKVYVLSNDAWGLAVVGSANLTNNPRIEACTVTEDRAIAEWHRQWIEDVLAKASPFETQTNISAPDDADD